MSITFFDAVARFFPRSTALGVHSGQQYEKPMGKLVRQSAPVMPEQGLQLSAVWACVTLLSETIASLPIAVYERTPEGYRREARETRAWMVLHSPNADMTAHDFWVTMGLNRFLRGNAYALIERDSTGALVSLTPLPADQVSVSIVGGEVLYTYSRDNKTSVFKSDKILHWKGIGTGYIGFSTLEYMQATTTELKNAQTNATELYGNGRQLVGLLMVDQDLSAKQIAQLKARYSKLEPIAGTPSDFLHVLPGDMKFQQIAMSAADAQLLETRQFGIDEIGRWFGVPSALINSPGGTAASGIEPIVESFYRSTIQPICTGLEQALTRRLFSTAERERFNCEFKLSALQRASIASRYDSYSKALQNGFMTRNEVRRLENLPSVDGADALTAQSNLVPLDQLGAAPDQDQTMLGDPIKQ